MNVHTDDNTSLHPVSCTIQHTRSDHSGSNAPPSKRPNVACEIKTCTRWVSSKAINSEAHLLRPISHFPFPISHFPSLTLNPKGFQHGKTFLRENSTPTIAATPIQLDELSGATLPFLPHCQ